jgi:heat shock protein HslJ
VPKEELAGLQKFLGRQFAACYVRRMKLIGALALVVMVSLAGCTAAPALAPEPVASADEVAYEAVSTIIPEDISGTWYLSGSADEELDVTFEPDGRFYGFDGCNWYGGESWAYSSDGNLILDETITTLKGCLGERESFNVSTATSAGMSGDELLFFDDMGEVVAVGVREIGR